MKIKQHFLKGVNHLMAEVRRPSTISLQRTLDKNFPTSLKSGESLSGFLTLTIFCLLTGVHSISRIAAIANDPNFKWRKFVGLQLPVGPDVSTCYKLLRRLDYSLLEQGTREWVLHQGISLAKDFDIPMALPHNSKYYEFEQFRTLLGTLTSKESELLYEAIMHTGGWTPDKPTKIQ